VPVGGTAGQVLAKIDGTNYNTEWVTGGGGGGSGTVTTVSVTTANGVSGSVANATTTPAISITLGAITPSSVAAVGTVTGSNLSGTNTGDQTNISGNAATVTTNANLTGHVTSVGNTAVLGSFTVAQLNTALSDGDIATGGGTATGTNTGDQTNITGNAATVTTNANLTGHVTSVGNAAVLGSFTVAQLNTAISDGDIATGGGTVTGASSGTNTGDNATNSQYSGLVSNATHTGDATGATALTVVKINGVSMAGLATGMLKNTTGTGAPSIATGADLPAMTATVGGAVPTPPNNTTTFLRGDGTFAAVNNTRAVQSVNFGTGARDVSLFVADATITANDSIQCNIVGGSTMTAEEAAIQYIDVSVAISVGVGYTLYCAAPLGAIGIIGVLTEKVGV
jgi:hypothetical protein